MTDTAKTAAVATTAADSAKAEDVAAEASIGKEAIYAQIADYVKAKTGKNIGKSGGMFIFNLSVAGIFATAVKEGTFRFNGGYGSLHVRQYKAGSRRLPSGQTTTFGEREKVRYEEGVTVQNLVSGHDANEAGAAPATPATPVEKAPKAAAAPKASAPKDPVATSPNEAAVDLS